MKLNKITLIITIFLVLIIIFHLLGWPFFIGKIFLPLRYFFSSFDNKTTNFLDFFLTKKNLFEENKKLSIEMAKVIVENIRLKMVEEENEKLRKELNFIKRENYRSILANIVGRKEEGGLTWFILDRGSNDGLKEGLVAVSEGVVVGKIIKTTKNFSFLLPLSDEKVNLAVFVISPEGEINEKNKTEGIARGKNGLITEIDLIPLNKEIKNGDLVITSGLEYVVPKGLFVGTLKDVEKNPSDIFYRAIVESPIELEELEMVSIIIPKIEE